MVLGRRQRSGNVAATRRTQGASKHEFGGSMKRNTPALIIACLALFLAAGGPAAAVNAADAASRLLTGKQIKDNSITGGDIKNGTLVAKDFKTSELARIAPASQGAAGAKGA